jgi:hypothetical protein
MEHPPGLDFATDFDHTDEAWVADPYPIMEDLRERCPVAHSERYGGMWAPMTHATVSAIAKTKVGLDAMHSTIGRHAARAVSCAVLRGALHGARSAMHSAASRTPAPPKEGVEDFF